MTPLLPTPLPRPPTPKINVGMMFFFSLGCYRGDPTPNIDFGGGGAGSAGRIIDALKWFSRYFFPGMVAIIKSVINSKKSTIFRSPGMGSIQIQAFKSWMQIGHIGLSLQTPGFKCNWLICRANEAKTMQNTLWGPRSGPQQGISLSLVSFAGPITWWHLNPGVCKESPICPI